MPTNKPTTYRTLLLASALAMPMLVIAGDGLAATDPELKRVVLSSGGVGYFEYRMEVDGEAQVPIDIRLDQVDDVLKSLVVFDGAGTIGLVRMPGKAPLEVAFRDLPFSRQALTSTASLLNALAGAEVTVGGDRDLTGRIVNVVAENGLGSDGTQFNQHRVTLSTDQGLQTAVLERSTRVTFTDPELQEQINQALVAIATNRRQDRRQLDLRLAGEGKRPVEFGYVVSAPLWKTAYRLTVTETDQEGEGAMAGWAVLENLSGQDWDDVELVVTSGNPVTFRQALYESYFVDRPSIPVEVLGRVLPPTDKGGVGFAQQMASQQPEEDLLRQRAGRSAPQSLAAFAPRAEMEMADSMGMMAMNESVAAAAPPPQAKIAAAQSQEAATQVVFRYPEPVTVSSGQSVMLPIVARDVPAEQVALYNQSTHRTHPLASVRLTNDGETGLPPGVVTLYTRGDDQSPISFAGDAQLAPLPAGDSRLLSFAVDQKIKVVPTNEYSETRAGGTIVDGIFRLTVKQSSTTTYSIENTAKTARGILVEHPKQGGWDLIVDADTAEATEETDRFYRLPVRVDGGETIPFAVTLERPIVQRYEMSNLDGSQIAAFAAARTLSKEVRAAMAELAQYQQRVEDRRRVLESVDGKIDRRSRDQERVRRLLGSVPRDSDLYRRYLADLGRQEDMMEAHQEERLQADRQLERARAALIEFVRELNIEG
ncbi:MAG: DUF4139 domain-containing protein [Alphaproteobacteria bacterium]|nr:DUF4139 domain-containing protein [Alphaproteobacteria bacterium SS10]